MSIPSTLVTKFLQLLLKRRFTEAERILLQLREKVQITEWNKGYLQALNGMLIAQKTSDDQYLFLSNVSLIKKAELRKFQSDFSKYAKSGLNADYDRGFFSAWSEYMRILSKVKRVKSKK